MGPLSSLCGVPARADRAPPARGFVDRLSNGSVGGVVVAVGAGAPAICASNRLRTWNGVSPCASAWSITCDGSNKVRAASSIDSSTSGWYSRGCGGVGNSVVVRLIFCVVFLPFFWLCQSVDLLVDLLR